MPLSTLIAAAEAEVMISVHRSRPSALFSSNRRPSLMYLLSEASERAPSAGR